MTSSSSSPSNPYKNHRDPNRYRDLKAETNPEYPLPPLNVDITYGFDSHLNAFDIRWDSPAGVPGNARWHVVGVNIYRSDDSEFGPYYKIHNDSVGATFYRDRTVIEKVLDEDVTDRFIASGQDSVAGRWIFKTRHYPVVIPTSEGVPTESPGDIHVLVHRRKHDGSPVLDSKGDPVVEPVTPRLVYGLTGEVELQVDKRHDPRTNSLLDPILPGPYDGVTCSYHYARGVVPNELNRKTFYRITTLGYRTDWEGVPGDPTTLIETPLEWCEPKTIHHMENMDYIWREAIRRNAWILDQGGERVWLFIRKWHGQECVCNDPDYKFPRSECLECFGTGIVGGYEGPYEIKVAPPDVEKRIVFDQTGFTMEENYEVWTGPSPMVSQRDFIVKQNNDRYSIGPVRMPTNRGNVLQQHFSIDHIDENDIRYKVPMTGTYTGEGGYPKTRTWEWEEEDKIKNPQMTDRPQSPEGINERGRTPTYENITRGQ